MKLKAIIVEDEFNAREELEYLLLETNKVEIAAKCANALEGIKAVNKFHPDVLFLDIHLPAIDGFEMLSMIEESVLPRIVFVTAFDQFAIKAFENNATDYLLKPIGKDRLLQAIEKIEKSIFSNIKQKIDIPLMKRIPSYGTHKIKLVNVDEIEFLHSNEAGVYFIYDGKKCYTDLTLATIETKTKLFRCHKQYLINLDKIDEIIFDDNSRGKVRTYNQFLIPVSRHYLKNLKEKLGL